MISRLAAIGLVVAAATVVAACTGTITEGPREPAGAKGPPEAMTLAPPTEAPPSEPGAPPASQAAEPGDRTVTPTGSAERSPHGEVLVAADVSYQYQSLAEWASQFDGVAIVRISEVGRLQWNTPTGERPSEEQLHAHDVGLRYWIGRPFTLELERTVRGRWTGPGEQTQWWVAGGQLGADVTQVPEPPVPTPDVGQRAIAFTGVFDLGTGVKEYVGAVFPVDDAGRVITMDRGEGVTIENIDSRVR